jgi:hypothetical protein
LLANRHWSFTCAGSQTCDSQSGDANQSWTAKTESQSDNASPTPTTESLTQNGNRTLDKQSVQRRDSDGHYEPYADHQTHPRSHSETWEKYQRVGKVPLESEYEEFPGGRVIYDTKTKHFTVLADRRPTHLLLVRKRI